MKGVIFSTSFFIMILSVFLSLSFFVHYDHNRAIINNNFKKSLFTSANQIVKENNKEAEILDLVIENLYSNLPDNFDYTFELLGYNEDPFLMRIKLIAKSKNMFYSFSVEETIVERENDDV